MDLLYATTSHLLALRDWTEDALPATVDGAPLTVVADQLPNNIQAPFVFLELARPEAGFRGGPPMAGDQWSALAVLARCCGTVPTQASRMADLLRWSLVGRSPSGAYVLAMADLGGSPVLLREGGEDPVPDFAGPVPQVSDAFTFRLGRGADDEL